MMIREDDKLAGTSLVMMTSMGSRGDAIRLEKAGFAAYLTKPVKQSQMHDCLLAVLDRGAGFSAPRSPHIITRHSLADQAKSRVRVLLAEDNPINQKVALATLEKLGYRADAVGDGQEALAALASRPYDLVLMDVQMPNMDGLEATGLVRDPQSSVRDHDIPIIALTAAAMKGDPGRSLAAAGWTSSLTKPLRPGATSRSDPRLTAGADGGTSAAAPSAGAPLPAPTPVFDREALLHTLGGSGRRPGSGDTRRVSRGCAAATRCSPADRRLRYGRATCPRGARSQGASADSRGPDACGCGGATGGRCQAGGRRAVGRRRQESRVPGRGIRAVRR